MCPLIVIAGTQSGVGKTSLSLGITAALVRKGFRVQTFKVGPDFLDPTYLSLVSGRPCYNLDGWMSGKEYVRQLFVKTTANADIAVIEGVMGLFDGASVDCLQGSTAQIASWLSAPVILVAAVRGMARSLAAMVSGYVNFESSVEIKGVIANFCGSPEHCDLLRRSLSVASLPPLIGAIPKDSLPSLSSRHLGLVTADRHQLPNATVMQLADAVERHISIDDIFSIGKTAPPVTVTASTLVPANSNPVRIGVAHDEAFHFYYHDLLEKLEANNCKVVRFSPLHDMAIPGGLDAVYLCGGYPEEHARELSANQSMLRSIREYAQAGGVIYAECGGLIYLSLGVELKDGKRYPLAGILPSWTRMLHKRSALGYREIRLQRDTLFGSSGTVLRGHEFHYSELLSDPSHNDPAWEHAYRFSHPKSLDCAPEGYLKGNILVSYIHLHLASHTHAISSLIKYIRHQSTKDSYEHAFTR